MYNELILSVQKFKESSPDTDVIPDGEKLLFINYLKKKHRIFNIYILNSGFIWRWILITCILVLEKC